MRKAQQIRQSVVNNAASIESWANEEAAVAAALGSIDLTGYRVSFDAAHMVKNTLRHLTLYNRADYLKQLKANQTNAFAKAQQLLPGALPPSTGVD